MMMMKSDASDEGDILSDGDAEYVQGNTAGSRYTTGNEADIEDNLVPVTPTPNTLWQKLREKPAHCTPATPCRLASVRKEYRRNRPSTKPTSTQRLVHRPKSALETITDTIEKPEGSVPLLALPHWHCLSLDKKIPDVPAPKGLLYYSPGKLCTKLHREPKLFSLTDPYNRERVVGSPYTALHDPHAKECLSRPETRRLLNSQGLINENDEIIYSLREFNKFRDYLRTLYADDVHQNVHFADELWKSEREQIRHVQYYLSLTEGKAAEWRKRFRRSKRVAKQNRNYQISRMRQKAQGTEVRLIAWAKEKEQHHLNRIVRGYEKCRLQREKLESMNTARENVLRKACHQSLMKDFRCSERKNADMEMLKKAHETFLLEWMDAKINQSRARLDCDVRMNISTRETLKRNAAQRQRRVEAYRQNLPVMIEKKRLSKLREFELARKYFYLWLEITRKRVSSVIRDEAHESVWIKGAAGTLDETVKYLRFQTDTYGKLDDFILNIIRLKQQIARQLALEEEDEFASTTVATVNVSQQPIPENVEAVEAQVME